MGSVCPPGGEEPSGLFRDVEAVVGGVRYGDFLADVQRVAARRWCVATFGVDALDGCYAREHAVPIVTENRDEKPRNGIRLWGRRIGNGLADNSAAVIGFPRRSGEMFAE